jgi:formate hydrogenlyase transcriptional activator
MNIEYDILIVDDEIPSLQLLTELLDKEGYQVRPAEEAQTAIDSALAKPPSLILLDVRMPEIDGFEICRRLKQDRRTLNVPIIFVSALIDIEARIQGFEAGGVDFISKPFQELEILARVRTHTRLHRMQENLEQLVDERMAEVAESDARFRSVVENANEAIVVAQDMIVKYSNRKVSDLTGYMQEEINSARFDRLIHPGDLETVLSEYRTRVSGEQPANNYPIRIISKEGQEKHVTISSALIEWDGKPATLAMLADITEEVRAKEELKKSEEGFRNLIEQSPMPIEILSLDGKILQSNPSWRKLWGVDEVVAAETMEKYNMLTDPQLKKLGINHLVEKAFSGERVALPPVIYDANEAAEEFEIENLVGLKSPWIQCYLYPIKDKNGNLVNIINTYVDISDQKNIEIELRTAFEEIKNLTEKLEVESAYLQDEIKLEHNFENIIGRSETLKYVLQRAEQVAPMDAPALIMGETGTGKELVSRAIHQLSHRHKRPMIKVNCAALPDNLIESELFGHVKGAFTGADHFRQGRFELADGSTLFLDEIGEMPQALQAKLLRVIESGEFERVGSSETIISDARIIATTNRVLEEEVEKGRFRSDLWYRLKVFPITVPPLRERPEDIPLLVKWFLDQFTAKIGKRVGEVPKGAMQKLQNYPWPGNVRELKHTIEGAVIAAQGKKLNFELPAVEATTISDLKPLEEMECDYILKVLRAANWKIGGENSAAAILGMNVNTLRGRMKKLGIKRPKPKFN